MIPTFRANTYKHVSYDRHVDNTDSLTNKAAAGFQFQVLILIVHSVLTYLKTLSLYHIAVSTLSLLSIDLRDKIPKKYFSSFGQFLIIGTYMRCVCDCNPT